MSRQDSDAEQQPLPSRRTFIVMRRGSSRPLLPRREHEHGRCRPMPRRRRPQSAADPLRPPPMPATHCSVRRSRRLVEMLVDGHVSSATR